MKGSPAPVYAGETKCVAQYSKTKAPCREWARYRATDGSQRLLCGVHSRKGKRTDLPLNPRADEVRAALIALRVQEAHALAAERLAANAPRLVTAATFAGMMREFSFVPAPGHLPLFPNNKHGHGFGYGYDLSALSPMRLGPVHHGQPSLPVAQNIENYHQFNKVFPNELSDEVCECTRSAQWAHFKPARVFFEKRAEAYADVVAHRHKYDSAELRKANKDYVKAGSKAQVNKPMYSVHETAAGQERHYTYLESRYFYCHQMETLIGTTRAAQWQQVQDLLARGYALQLVGYDAYTPRGTDPDTLYAHYQDEARPFGHEMVILAMLCIDDVAQRPWNRYRREHAAIYE